MNKPLTMWDVIVRGVYGETEWYKRLGADEEARMIQDGTMCRDCSQCCRDTCCVKCKRWVTPQA